MVDRALTQYVSITKTLQHLTFDIKQHEGNNSSSISHQRLIQAFMLNRSLIDLNPGHSDSQEAQLLDDF